MDYFFPMKEFVWPVAATVAGAFLVWIGTRIWREPSPSIPPEMAERQWAKLQNSADISALKRFAKHSPRYYAELALERIALLEKDADTTSRVSQYSSEGRIKVDARNVHGALGGRFKPGADSESFRDFDIAPELVVVSAGEFWMGPMEGEGGNNARPRHKVVIPKPLAVGKFPVTFDEWDAAQKDKDWRNFSERAPWTPDDADWGRGRRPVINVSWEDAQAYVKWLSGKSGQPYRLLSEAEWEYSCRAGTDTAYSFGDNKSDLDGYGWYSGNSGGKTHPVGEKAANAFGLHDMHGNVWEWCEDRWNESYKDKPESLKANGGAWTTGDNRKRVIRGGCFGDLPSNLPSAHRDKYAVDYRYENVGFRLVRTLSD